MIYMAWLVVGPFSFGLSVEGNFMASVSWFRPTVIRYKTKIEKTTGEKIRTKKVTIQRRGYGMAVWGTD